MDAKYAQNIGKERARDAAELLAAQKAYVPNSIPADGKVWMEAHAAIMDIKNQVYGGLDPRSLPKEAVIGANRLIYIRAQEHYQTMSKIRGEK